MGGEETLCATAPLEALTEVRSTLIGSSCLALKERGLEARYLGHLPKKLHDVTRFTPAGVWLPVDVAVAHYAACDALGLSERDVLGMGSAVAKLTQRSMVQMAMSAANAAGVTPWTILGTTDRYWARLYRGSGIRILKLGPKDGRFEALGTPLARYSYWRVALAGIIEQVTAPFCRKMYVRTLPSRQDDASAYSISWA